MSTNITLPLAAAQQALEALRLNNDEWKALADSGDCGHWTAESQDHYKQTNAAIVALEAALAQEPEPVQEPSYEPKFFDTVLYTGASERVTVVSSVSSVSSVSVTTQPYRVLTDADLDAIRKIVREGEEK